MPLNDADKGAMAERYDLGAHHCDCGFSGTILDWKFKNSAGDLVLFERLTLREAEAVASSGGEMYCPKCGLPNIED